MTSILVALTVLSPAPAETVADFFPLRVGTKWHYTESSRGGDVSYVDEVGSPTDIEGQPATPIYTKMGGRVIDTRYYRLDSDTVWWVASGAKKALTTPQPILKLGAGKVKWLFDGETLFVNEPAPLKMENESSRKGRRKVLDVEREVLEVTQKGVLGGDKGTQVRGSMVAVYARDIGLVELKSEQTMANSKSTTTLRLTKFEPGPGG